jgi:metal-sulfur cluster biosynthetic enzyme
MSEQTYWDRTDSFEEKLKMLEAAWKRKDFRLARALAHSLRNTAIQAQSEEETPGKSIPENPREETVDSLPASWRAWAQGWKHFQTVVLDDTIGQQRPPEPVEFLLSVPADHATSLAREVRVVQVAGGQLREVPCQVFGEVVRGDRRISKVLILASGVAHQRQSYLMLYGNPDAELPEYCTDLETRGEGFALDIENDFFRASLSRQMGQLERLTIKREHGLELFAGGEGHGEPPGIDWAHDYVTSGRIQKMRITLWESCPDYEVVRGPLCTMIRRWGFPYSPVHPIFSPARMHVDVEYRFYAGLPWFHKLGTMTATKDVEIDALRDDEWVFSGQSFTSIVWMGPDGKLRFGDVDPQFKDQMWAVGFCNEKSNDSFVGLFLEHRGDGLPELKHSGNPMMFYRWHGHVWSRYPLPGKQVPAGAVLHQKNAYAAIAFTAKDGPRRLEELRHRLVNPYAVSAGELNRASTKEQPGRLARPGEAGDSPIPKKLLWDALQNCKDEQLYVTDINVVDLGLVYDIRVRGDVVHVLMTMPHRGRPRLGYFTYGSGGNTTPVRQELMKVPGVRKVVIEQTWEPGWNSNRLTPTGRKKLGLDT